MTLGSTKSIFFGLESGSHGYFHRMQRGIIRFQPLLSGMQTRREKKWQQTKSQITRSHLPFEKKMNEGAKN
jgi:hypothetical protein